ncbi:MAG: hypothetical protein RMK91_02385 [Pseudanabaenaceae cyanobacterium SKYGB_i_bin29]|nr:hypothetical protein [Pseudanabaenaceae cyanobacterium SKYG29]MDW8420694.1 hypothetical protein [Pseudanabaenaceae cyanobacterium SKYGB_i_bin29]
MNTEQGQTPEQKSAGGLGGLISGLQQKASEIAEGVKDKIESVVGEETVKKVTETLNTDVGELAKDAAGKTIDAVENLVGKDLNRDSTIGGKPAATNPEKAEG